MRTALFLILLSAITVSAETLDVSHISNKIDTVQQTKKTSPTLDYNVFDPFAKAKPLLAKKGTKPVVNTSRPIIVQTILNNHALIDGRWVDVGGHVHGATIKAINQNNIIVSKDQKQITIPLRRKKSIIKTKERSR